MKKILFSALVLAFACHTAQSQVRHEIDIPDLKGYQTLKCDFHIHTVFSDGLVWPTVRVDEAYREGLDAIALTEHIEYRPHQKTLSLPTTALSKLPNKQQKQKHFIDQRQRNHPLHASRPLQCNLSLRCRLARPRKLSGCIPRRQTAKCLYFLEPSGLGRPAAGHNLVVGRTYRIIENGCMHGIEIVNGKYFPEAHQWCLDKKLTMIGNSDIHQPIQTDIDFAKGEHRGMTLVFAKERTIEGIREALLNRRTAVYYGENLIGEEIYLKELFENAIEIKQVKKTDNAVSVTLYNNSDLIFRLKKTEHDARLVYFRDYSIKPHCQHTITIRLNDGVKSGKVNFEVTNLWVAPGKGLSYSYDI